MKSLIVSVASSHLKSLFFFLVKYLEDHLDQVWKLSGETFTTYFELQIFPTGYLISPIQLPVISPQQFGVNVTFSLKRAVMIITIYPS